MAPQESHFRNHFRMRKLSTGEDACLPAMTVQGGLLN